MAISAVWVAFWLLIAATAAATARMQYPLTTQLNTFSLIVAMPPAALLIAGAIGRWLFKAVDRRGRPGGRAAGVREQTVRNADV
jgi:hypothetical protein